MEWESRWIRWPDLWLPLDRGVAEQILRLAWHRAADERVEIACGGGHGRTGTALACLAVLDGLAPGDAVAYVRAGYHRAGGGDALAVSLRHPAEGHYVRAADQPDADEVGHQIWRFNFCPQS